MPLLGRKSELAGVQSRETSLQATAGALAANPRGRTRAIFCLLVSLQHAMIYFRHRLNSRRNLARPVLLLQRAVWLQLLFVAPTPPAAAICNTRAPAHEFSCLARRQPYPLPTHARRG